jgi:hypothetical protein
MGLQNTKAERLDLMKFPNIRGGFQFLTLSFDQLQPQHRYERMCYYLFALEKTAEVFDVKTLGGKDWYAWGAEWLVNNQQGEGGWYGPRGEDGGNDARADACFALLFLKRANPAPDLTLNLLGIVREPVRKTAPEQLPRGLPDPHALDQIPIREEPKQTMLKQQHAQESKPAPQTKKDPPTQVARVTPAPKESSPAKIEHKETPKESSHPEPVAMTSTPSLKLRKPPPPVDEEEPVKSEEPYDGWLLAQMIGGPLLLLLGLLVLVLQRRRAPAGALTRQRCGQCGTAVQVRATVAGTPFKCPRCGTVQRLGL